MTQVRVLSRAPRLNGEASATLSQVDIQAKRDYDNKRRATRRAILRAALGGECQRCGTTEELEFDHIVPGGQKFWISRGILKPWNVLLAELDKCQLLCRPCHIVKSRENSENGGGQNRINEHGTEAYYNRLGCRCTLCVAARRAARIRRGDRSDKPSANIYGGRGRYGTVEHGGGKTGKANCKCALCKEIKSAYMREYNKRD